MHAAAPQPRELLRGQVQSSQSLESSAGDTVADRSRGAFSDEQFSRETNRKDYI